MAENGGFRSKFGGFHKDDVLRYIDELQQEHSAELAALKAQATAEREAYEKALSDANAELVRQFDELQAARAEEEKLQQLINEQYEANRTLREQASTTPTDKVAWDDAMRRIHELQQQLTAAKAESARLAEENTRYRELVNNVGRFVVEVRAMGQRYLDDANDRCQSRLSTISQMVTALNSELTAAAGELSAADSALGGQTSRAGEQLDKLARDMERSAALMGDSGTPAPQSRFF